jgi:hypothetical protein
MTPIQVKHQIDQAEDMAKRNGFKLDIGNDIGIMSFDKAPYARGVTVKALASFEEVIIYFQGYEQMQREQQELDRATKDIK